MRVNPDRFGACIDQIAERGKISKAEALDLLNEVADRGEKMRRTGQADPFVSAARELAQSLKERAAADREDALRNASIRDGIMGEIERGGGLANAELTLRSILHGTNKGGRDSIESQWRGNAAGWQAQFAFALRKAGLERTAISGELDADIARALWAINAGQVDRVGSMSPARTIAETMQPLLDHVRERLNAAGARIGDAVDYVGQTLHDPARMRRAAGPGMTPDQAFDAWWEKTEPLLAPKTFDGVQTGADETPAAARRRFGRSVFDALISGVHMTTGGAESGAEGAYIPPAFEGSRNLARKLSQARVLFWKDADSWHSYMTEFGVSRTLAEGVMMTLDRSARQLALLEKLGTNPAGNFALILRRIQEQYRDDLDGVKDFQAKISGLDAVLAHLDGRASIPANEMFARLGSSLRTWESLSSLGGVGLTHFASIWPTVTSEMVHHGESRLATMGKMIGALLRGRGGEDRQEVAAQLGSYANGMVRDMYDRWQPEDTIPGRLSSLAGTFMKYTGLHYIFDNTQAAVREMLANQLARNAGKRFADLDPHLAQILGKYGIEGGEWELLRQVPEMATAQGHAYLTPRDALRIDPASAEALLRARGELADDASPDAIARAVSGLGQRLSDRLYAYYGDAAAHAVVTPGVRERAMVLGQDRPGSFGGELRRFIAQFKVWPLAVLNQVIGREVYMSLTRSKAAWNLGVLAALSAVSGYLRLTANDAINGRPMRSPLDPSTLGEALAEGGGLGVLGDFLFGEASRMNGGLVGAFGGPVIGDTDRIVRLFGEWKQGKAGWSDLARFAAHHVPFANLIYLKGALDYLVWYHLYEAASPGWWERTNRRMIRQQGRAMSGYTPGAPIPYTPWGIGGNAAPSEQQQSRLEGTSAPRALNGRVQMPVMT